MNKSWRPYALHILDAIAKIRRIQERGNLVQDDVLYDAALLRPERCFTVYSGAERYSKGQGIEVIDVAGITSEISNI